MVSPLQLKEPRIVVHKARRTLELFAGNQFVRAFPIALGFEPLQDKVCEGDGATPEGEFYLFVKNNKSAYHLSLGISYPNIADAERGLAEKLIDADEYHAILSANSNKLKPPQHTRLGGLIYIHGFGAHEDWTRGCVALENDDIEELYSAVTVGTPVEILP